MLGSAAAAALTAVTGNTNMQRARVAALKENLSTSPYPPPTANEMNVGILALEAYFPSTFIEQEELEVHNGIPKGKYTIGLGQTAMSITGEAWGWREASSITEKRSDKYEQRTISLLFF